MNIPLAGYIVGNGATNWAYDVQPAFPNTAFYFDLIPRALLDTFNSNNCSYNNANIPVTNPPICDTTWDKIQDLTGGLNWYDLYRKVYPDTLLSGNRQGSSIVNGEEKIYKRGRTMYEGANFAKHMLDKDGKDNTPILGDYVSDYLNREDVRAALHIPTTAPAWEQCAAEEALTYYIGPEASQWIYTVMQNRTRIMFYSGDTDGAVPTYGTKQWLSDLAWPITSSWRPWYTDNQVSGYTESYDGLDFVTVKGVGHMAPQWARKPVTDMVTAWIHQEPF